MNSVLIGFRSLPLFVVLELGPQAGRFVLNTIVISRESKTLPRAADRVFFSSLRLIILLPTWYYYHL